MALRCGGRVVVFTLEPLSSVDCGRTGRAPSARAI